MLSYFKMVLRATVLVFLYFASGNADSETRDYKHVGEFGNKFYFTDITRSRTQYESRIYCESFGYSLTTIESPEEFEYLRKLVGFNERFWLSARSDGMYHWENGIGEKLGQVLFPVRNQHSLNCVLLHFGIRGPELYADPCDSSGYVSRVYWPLCQAGPGHPKFESSDVK